MAGRQQDNGTQDNGIYGGNLSRAIARVNELLWNLKTSMTAASHKGNTQQEKGYRVLYNAINQTLQKPKSLLNELSSLKTKLELKEPPFKDISFKGIDIEEILDRLEIARATIDSRELQRKKDQVWWNHAKEILSDWIEANRKVLQNPNEIKTICSSNNADEMQNSVQKKIAKYNKAHPKNQIGEGKDTLAKFNEPMQYKFYILFNSLLSQFKSGAIDSFSFAENLRKGLRELGNNAAPSERNKAAVEVSAGAGAGAINPVDGPEIRPEAGAGADASTPTPGIRR